MGITSPDVDGLGQIEGVRTSIGFLFGMFFLKAQVMAIAAGDSWLFKGANILLFGPPGSGKSRLAAAIGLALIGNTVQFVAERQSENDEDLASDNLHDDVSPTAT